MGQFFGVFLAWAVHKDWRRRAGQRGGERSVLRRHFYKAWAPVLVFNSRWSVGRVERRSGVQGGGRSARRPRLRRNE